MEVSNSVPPLNPDGKVGNHLNKLRGFQRSHRLTGGAGIVVQNNPDGTIISLSRPQIIRPYAASAGGAVQVFKFANSFWNTTVGGDSVPICGIYGYPYDFTTTGGTGVPILSASDLWLISGETLTTGSAAGTKSYSYDWGGQLRTASWTVSGVTRTEYDFVTPEYNSSREILAIPLNNPAVVIPSGGGFIPVLWLEVSPRYWANDMLYTPP